MSGAKKQYHIELNFQSIKLPFVRDILILCKKYPQGKEGVMQAFKFIAPDEFDMIELSDDIDETVEAIMINKKLLKKMSLNGILEVLKNQVFPYLSQGEVVKVDMDLQIFTTMSWDPGEN